MSFISKDELEMFKSFRKAKGVKDTFLNYIVWKNTYRK